MKEEIRERIDRIKKGEVPEGYRRTKVGILPEEWNIKKLSEMMKENYIVDHLDGNHGALYPKNSEFLDEGVPYVSANSIVNGRINFKLCKFLSEDRANQFKKGIARNRDVLFAHNATVGPVALLESNFKKVILSTTLTYYRCNSNCILPEYLYQYMQSRYFCNQYERIMKQSTRNQLPITTQRDLYHILPLLPEQQKIASILSTWDKAIELKEQLIEAKKEQKKGLMKRLLTGEIRLPGFNGEWEEVDLKEVFERVTRKNSEGNSNVLTISAQRGLINQEDFFNKSVASATLDNYYLLKKSEFAYNKSYSKGYPMGAIKRLNQYESGVVTTLYICFKLIDGLNNDGSFYEHYFESGLLVKPLTQIAHEGGRAHGLLNVSPQDFFELKIKRPAFEEQCEISELLSKASEEIDLLQQELSQLKQQKKGLMQLLLTGIVRVQL